MLSNELDQKWGYSQLPALSPRRAKISDGTRTTLFLLKDTLETYCIYIESSTNFGKSNKTMKPLF